MVLYKIDYSDYIYSSTDKLFDTDKDKGFNIMKYVSV